MEKLEVNEGQFDRYLSWYDQSLDAIELNNLSKELSEIHNEVIKPGRSNFRVWYMAAAVVIIGVIGFLISRPESSISFDDVYEPYPDLISIRGEEEKLMTEAMRLYSLGDFAGALDKFSLIQPDSLITEYHFYRGIAALGANDSKLAVSSLLNIGIDPDSNKYWQQTRWYLGLAYWQLGDTVNSLKLLEAIEENEYGSEVSQKLAEQLGNLP